MVTSRSPVGSCTFSADWMFIDAKTSNLCACSFEFTFLCLSFFFCTSVLLCSICLNTASTVFLTPQRYVFVEVTYFKIADTGIVDVNISLDKIELLPWVQPSPQTVWMSTDFQETVSQKRRVKQSILACTGVTLSSEESYNYPMDEFCSYIFTDGKQSYRFHTHIFVQK
jgi:hypothetical protein